MDCEVARVKLASARKLDAVRHEPDKSQLRDEGTKIIQLKGRCPSAQKPAPHTSFTNPLSSNRYSVLGKRPY